jgi:hypothetical protein
MTYTIEYKRTIRLRPYETVSIGLLEEFDGAVTNYEMNYHGIKAQVDKWCDEAREEFGE